MSSGAVIAAAMLGSTVSTIYSGQKAASAQARAQDQAVKRASANDLKAQQAFNAKNRKQPNSASALAKARQAAKGGVSGTMLTSAQGAQAPAAALNKTTLLGQ